MLDRIVAASVPSMVSANEDRVRKLEAETLLIREKMESAAGRCDEALGTANSSLPIRRLGDFAGV